MRTVYVSVLLVFAVAGTLLGQDKPNVVFVMPDDISHNAFSYFNSDGPRTPHIDKLAESSVRLTDFHVSPTCAPTRAALMTGRFNDVTGVWHTVFGRNQLRKDEITMADVFKHNGYATGLFFKWHLGDNYPFRPKDRGFDYVAWTKAGGVGQQPDYWGNMNTRASIWVNDKIVKMTDEDDGIEGAFTTNFFFNRAMEFMEENIQKSKPFFAYIPTATAHGPHHMPPDARSGVRASTGTIENIDKNMGRLIQFLDDRGIADNTILIFTTDNGSSTFLRGGKGSFYDGGTRVPCFVRWPAGNLGGEGEGRDVSPLTAHIDWLPTFMDIIGLEDVPNRLGKLAIHGRSFRPFLDSDPTNDPADYKDRAVTIVNMRTEDVEKFKSLSVKKDVWEGNNIAHKWRLCRSGANARWELYDVLIDERQGNNVIRDSAHAEIVAELKQEYEEWWRWSRSDRRNTRASSLDTRRNLSHSSIAMTFTESTSGIMAAWQRERKAVISLRSSLPSLARTISICVAGQKKSKTDPRSPQHRVELSMTARPFPKRSILPVHASRSGMGKPSMWMKEERPRRTPMASSSQ